MAWLKPFLADANGFHNASPTCLQGRVDLAGAQFNPTATSREPAVFDDSPVAVRELLTQMALDQGRIIGVNEQQGLSMMGLQGGDGFPDDRQEQFRL